MLRLTRECNLQTGDVFNAFLSIEAYMRARDESDVNKEIPENSTKGSTPSVACSNRSALRGTVTAIAPHLLIPLYVVRNLSG